ncbi:cation:proton antiporter [Desulfobacterales bacterium HSG17]|nr:cation:proton antiporter [Desulfobacterales bacterium HSG17]
MGFENSQMLFGFLAIFFLVALAAKQIGDFFAALKFPLITGFLCTGIIAGPYILNIIPSGAITELRFIDEIALAFISFAAGNELFVRQLKNRLKSIRFTTIGLMLSTFVLGGFAFLELSESIPFTQNMPILHRIAVAILAGSILIARSPSSAIAVVNELRARGPFTQTILGVTVIMDFMVILIFSISASIAGTILLGHQFDVLFILVLVLELGLSFGLGIVLSKIFQVILASQLGKNSKTFLIMTTGYGIFALSGFIRHTSDTHLPFEILLEPMLICMLGSFITTNYGPYRTELMKTLHDIAPMIYIAFFTLTGASLDLTILARTWPIALMLFGVRLGAIFIGTFTAGFLAGEKQVYNRISWMAFITQAGVGLGLAKEVAVEFPQWGSSFATIIIAVIVLNQIIGPPFFKWALHIAGEAHPKASNQPTDSVRDAVIFGLEGESLALARLLQSNHWEVKIATTQVDYVVERADDAEIEIFPIPDINLSSLNHIGLGRADAIVAMLSDEENYKICELAYENFGTRNLIARLHHRNHYKRFHELGVVVVEPATAIVNLLDQLVRSPFATTLLLGLDQGRDVIEFELRNRELSGIAIRELHLPLDIHILSIRRQGQAIVSVGFTRLQVGDWLTVVGSKSSLEHMMLQFGENRQKALVNLVGKAASSQIAGHTIEKEVSAIMNQQNDTQKIKFEELIEQSLVLDLDGPMVLSDFFMKVSEAWSVRLGIPEERLNYLLMEREKESSTAFRPDLAIPHIIIDGQDEFYILLARCKKGINFNELAPVVQAVFVLGGTKEQRDYHLYALSAIAKIVQQPHFLDKWINAKTKSVLRNIAASTKSL